MKRIIKAIVIVAIFWQLVGCFQPVDVPIGSKPEKEFTLIDDYISDGAILQQKSNLVIQGLSEEGAVIVATLYNHKDVIIEQSYSLTLSSGNWRIELKTPTASLINYYIIIDDSVHQRKIENLRFGHVWMIAGEAYLNTPMSEFKGDLPIVSTSNIAFYQPSETNSGWYYQLDDDYFNNVSEFAYSFARLLYDRLSIPVGIIMAQVESSHLDAWLNQDYIETRPRARSFVDLNNRYQAEVQGSAENYDQMSYLFETKIKPFTNMAITGILWYQGLTDLHALQNLTPQAKNEYFSLYSTNLTYVMQAIRTELENNVKIYLLQEFSYPEDIFDVTDIGNLREAQAMGSYFYTYTNIVTTYDIMLQSNNDKKTDWQKSINALAERIFQSVRTNTYYERINYSSTSYTNVIVSPTEIKIKFSIKLSVNKGFIGLVLLDEENEELNLKIRIDEDFLIIDLTTLEEDQQITKIIYAWDSDIVDCNLKSITGIPVVPFKINNIH